MFGIFGLAVSQGNYGALPAITAGTITGLASMWMVGKVFQAIAGLETDGTVSHNQVYGAKGTVYRTIKPG